MFTQEQSQEKSQERSRKQSLHALVLNVRRLVMIDPRDDMKWERTFNNLLRKVVEASSIEPTFLVRVRQSIHSFDVHWLELGKAHDMSAALTRFRTELSKEGFAEIFDTHWPMCGEYVKYCNCISPAHSYMLL